MVFVLMVSVLLTSNAADEPFDPEPRPWGSVELRAWTYRKGAAAVIVRSCIEAPEGYTLRDILPQTISVAMADSMVLSPVIHPRVSFFHKDELWSIFNPEEFENALENIGAIEGALLTLTGMLKDSTYAAGEDTFKILVLRGHGGPQSAEGIIPGETIFLAQNYPNPFSEKTVIRLQCPVVSVKEELKLYVYDLTGRLVKTLLDKSLTTNYSPLATAVSWNGTDSQENKVPSGIYFCRLQIGNYRETRKMMLIR